MSSTTTLDWDRSYRTGEHRIYWELSTPSPDLVGFLAAQGRGAGRRALDLGCGSGWDTIGLDRAGYDATGVDISPAAVDIAGERAAEHGSKARFMVGDVRRLDLPDSHFDLLTDRGCFHHFGPEDRTSYVAQAARLLRPGGLLFLRGSRIDSFPFKPVTQTEIDRHFAPSEFEAGDIHPFLMWTDESKLDANACVLRRIPSGP